MLTNEYIFSLTFTAFNFMSLINYLTISIHHTIGGAQLYITKTEIISLSAKDNAHIPFYFVSNDTLAHLPLLTRVVVVVISLTFCHYNKQTISAKTFHFSTWALPFCTCGAKESEFNERRLPSFIIALCAAPLCQFKALYSSNVHTHPAQRPLSYCDIFLRCDIVCGQPLDLIWLDNYFYEHYETK